MSFLSPSQQCQSTDGIYFTTVWRALIFWRYFDFCVRCQEWWDSLFKPSASEKSKPIPQRVEHSQPGPSAPAESRDPVESVKSTAAALRLSDALQRAPRSETGAVNAAALSGFSFSVAMRAFLQGVWHHAP